MSNYLIENLSRKDILTVYPLVRLTMPEIGIGDWRRFAISAISRRRGAAAGILIARAQNQQYICGMLTYRAVPDLALGRTLEISNMAALDILHPRQVIIELLRALGPLARLQNCRQVKIIVSETGTVPEDLSLALLEVEPASIFESALNVSFSAPASSA